mgnify:CR=1 FL=1
MEFFLGWELAGMFKLYLMYILKTWLQTSSVVAHHRMEEEGDSPVAIFWYRHIMLLNPKDDSISKWVPHNGLGHDIK